jgi:hypothetical protein
LTRTDRRALIDSAAAAAGKKKRLHLAMQAPERGG